MPFITVALRRHIIGSLPLQTSRGVGIHESELFGEHLVSTNPFRVVLMLIHRLRKTGDVAIVVILSLFSCVPPEDGCMFKFGFWHRLEFPFLRAKAGWRSHKYFCTLWTTLLSIVIEGVTRVKALFIDTVVRILLLDRLQV